MNTSKRISIDSVGKRALGNLLSFKVIHPNRQKILVGKVTKFTDVCMLRGRNLLPSIQLSVKLCDFAELHLRSFSTNHFQT